jgi:hypothetical protein
MLWELCYTSVPRGLKPGSAGFCTVAATTGLPEVLSGKLEMLSGYKELFPPHDSRFGRNPVLYSHVRLNAQGRVHHILSRVAAAPPDYTGRTNKFAHHVALEEGDLPPAGPAAVMAQAGVLQAGWDGQVRQLPPRPGLPRADLGPSDGRRWRDVTGDPGWAAVLAADFLRDPSRPVYLVYPLGVDLLPLLAEALALLPAERRWEVTFSTFHRAAPAGLFCAWRGLPFDAPEAADLMRKPGQRVLQLARTLGPAPANALAELARAAAAVPSASPQETSAGSAIHRAAAAVNQDQSGWRSAPETMTAAPRVTMPLAPAPPARSGSRMLAFVAGTVAGILVAGVAAVGLWQVPSMRAALVTSSKEHRQWEKEAQAQATEWEQQLQGQNKALGEKGKELETTQKALGKAQDAAARALAELKIITEERDVAKRQLEEERKVKAAPGPEQARLQRERDAYAKTIRMVLALRPDEAIPTAKSEEEFKQVLRDAWSKVAAKERELEKKLEKVEKDLETLKKEEDFWLNSMRLYRRDELAKLFKDKTKVVSFEKAQIKQPALFEAVERELKGVPEKAHSAETFARARRAQERLADRRQGWEDIETKLAKHLPKTDTPESPKK